MTVQEILSLVMQAGFGGFLFLVLFKLMPKQQEEWRESLERSLGNLTEEIGKLRAAQERQAEAHHRAFQKLLNYVLQSAGVKAGDIFNEEE